MLRRFFRWLFRRPAPAPLALRPGKLGVFVEDAHVCMVFPADCHMAILTPGEARLLASVLLQRAAVLSPCPCARCRAHATN